MKRSEALDQLTDLISAPLVLASEKEAAEIILKFVEEKLGMCPVTVDESENLRSLNWEPENENKN